MAYSILKSLAELNNDNVKVILQWIPSHIGLVGNEMVDKLAKEAAVDGVVFNCLPFFSNLIGLVKEYCAKLWSEYFDERSLVKGIWYKTIQPTLLGAPWFEGANVGGHDIVTSFRIRSGHIPLNKFGFMMGKTSSPNCSECDIVEDIYHVLMECVRNEAFRQCLQESCKVCLFDVGWCNSVLASPLSREARMLYKLVQIAVKNRNL